jgi:hypothetical protein
MPASRELPRFPQMQHQRLQRLLRHPQSYAVSQRAGTDSPDAAPASPESAPASLELRRNLGNCHGFSRCRSSVSRVCSGIRRATSAARELGQILQTLLQYLQSLVQHLWSCDGIPGAATASPDAVPDSPESASASAELRRQPRSWDRFSRRCSCVFRVWSSISGAAMESRELPRLLQMQLQTLQNLVRHPQSYAVSHDCWPMSASISSSKLAASPA